MSEVLETQPLQASRLLVSSGHVNPPVVVIILHQGDFCYCPFLLVLFKGGEIAKLCFEMEFVIFPNCKTLTATEIGKLKIKAEVFGEIDDDISSSDSIRGECPLSSSPETCAAHRLQLGEIYGI